MKPKSFPNPAQPSWGCLQIETSGSYIVWEPSWPQETFKTVSAASKRRTRVPKIRPGIGQNCPRETQRTFQTARHPLQTAFWLDLWESCCSKGSKNAFSASLGSVRIVCDVYKTWQKLMEAFKFQEAFLGGKRCFWSNSHLKS